ncbi:MAG: Hsp20/alpha crystallin family protein [Ktedonobacterales bacterium]
MAMTPWEPIDEFMDEALGGFMPLRRAMNRLLEDSFIRPTVAQPFRQLFPLDLRETDNEYVIDASIPGVKPDEIQITTAENILTIRASHKSQREEKGEKAGKYVRRELYEGEVSRTVRLPGPIDADKIAATYERGMLTIHVPKAQAAKAKQITVQVKELDKPAK